MNEDNLVIFGTLAFAIFLAAPSLKKLYQKYMHSNQLGGERSKIQLSSIFRSALSVVLQEKRVFLTLIAMVTVIFFLGLPFWAELQRQAATKTPSEMAAFSFLSLLGSSNPYEVVTSVNPARWNYVYSGFFSEVIWRLFVAPLASIGRSGVVNMIASLLSLLVMLPFFELSFLLWLKYSVTQRTKITAPFLGEKIKRLFPQFVVFHLVASLVFYFFVRSNWEAEVSLFVFLLTSPGDVLDNLQNLTGLLVMLVVRSIFLVVPIILVDREEKSLVAAFLSLKVFFQKYFFNYFRLILSFSVLTVLFSLVNFLVLRILPREVIQTIAPWTYYGLIIIYLKAITVTFGLGWLTVVLLKFVHEAR